MPFAGAMSEHPVTAHAVGEVAGELLERIGERPDLALVFVTASHAGALEDVAAAVEDLLHPLVTIGCAAESILGPHLEVERSPGICVLAMRAGPVHSLLLGDASGGLGGAFPAGWPGELPFTPKALLLLADPYSFPVDDLLEFVDAHHPGLPVLGGMASAALGPGGNRLALGRQVRTFGAVGALVGPGLELDAVVSQGCRPFGRPLVVTKSEGNVILELAGKSALERLVTQANESLSEEEVSLLEMGGLHIGRVIDEHLESFGSGDFLVRNILGADRRSGAIAVSDEVEIGTTVQFHLRDATSADLDLREILAGRQADAAIVFTCNGRGTRMFEQPHHDVRTIAETLGPLPVAGFFAAGELGPVGGRNFLHGFSAAIALLRDATGAEGQATAD